jgi:hypothetical protein
VGLPYSRPLGSGMDSSAPLGKWRFAGKKPRGVHGAPLWGPGWTRLPRVRPFWAPQHDLCLLSFQRAHGTPKRAGQDLALITATKGGDRKRSTVGACAPLEIGVLQGKGRRALIDPLGRNTSGLASLPRHCHDEVGREAPTPSFQAGVQEGFRSCSTGRAGDNESVSAVARLTAGLGRGSVAQTEEA